MRTIEELPYWLQNTIIIGREGEDDSNDEGDDSGDDDQDDEDEDKGGDAERKKVKEERRARRKAEREAREAKQAKDDDAEAKELDKEKKAREASDSKVGRLAARLLEKELTDAIMAEARNQKFIDPSDALLDEVRKAIDYDQDDEDPSDIDIDEDTVKAAVTKLAKKKAHLIGKPNEGEPSGSRFRTNGKPAGKTDEEALKGLYPSLQ
jgi:hypothetical protein